jgi:hypothetical protein
VSTDPIGGAPPEAAAYDPAHDTWRSLPSPPLTPRRSPAVTPVGTPVVVWGGQPGGGQPDTGRALVDGATYDPTSDSWTILRGDDHGAARSSTIAWVGDELYLAAGVSGPELGTGLALRGSVDQGR